MEYDIIQKQEFIVKWKSVNQFILNSKHIKMNT